VLKQDKWCYRCSLIVFSCSVVARTYGVGVLFCVHWCSLMLIGVELLLSAACWLPRYWILKTDLRRLVSNRFSVFSNQQDDLSYFLHIKHTTEHMGSIPVNPPSTRALDRPRPIYFILNKLGRLHSAYSSITRRLNSLLQDYTRLVFVVTRQFFSRLFAIQEHLVIHLNCFYRIQGLIVDNIFSLSACWESWTRYPKMLFRLLICRCLLVVWYE